MIKNISFSFDQNLKIITFGSCLSRYVANQFSNMFGGKVISSVFHNRSDIFLSNFVENKTGGPLFDSLLSLFSNLNEDQKQILANQSKEHIGKHNLSHGLQFFEALHNQPDLILIDNYIDIVGRAVEFGKDRKIFLTIKDPNLPYKLDNLLNIDTSILNFIRIAKFIRSSATNSKIVFLTFPGDAYAEENPRKSRFKAFSETFTSGDLDLIIKCSLNTKKYETNEHQHFKAPYYSGIASLIFSQLYL